MPITRREFLKKSGWLGVALTASSMRGFVRPTPKFRTTLDTNALARFVDPLPIPQISSPERTPESAKREGCAFLPDLHALVPGPATS